MTPLEEAAPQAMNPRHLTEEIREYEMTTYSCFTVNALEAALIDQLPEEVSDAPEPIDRVACATRAMAARPATA